MENFLSHKTFVAQRILRASLGMPIGWNFLPPAYAESPYCE